MVRDIFSQSNLTPQEYIDVASFWLDGEHIRLRDMLKTLDPDWEGTPDIARFILQRSEYGTLPPNLIINRQAMAAIDKIVNVIGNKNSADPIIVAVSRDVLKNVHYHARACVLKLMRAFPKMSAAEREIYKKQYGYYKTRHSM